ncbi:MAG: LysR family transcriptional regulator [Candidatus Latescibacteria bacterium]|jgi:DNA-binding transcriptional LysR family regulator|nr:LysR family transcriptional regulator [Candidatus Latescibacterota bacterium]
MELYQLRTFIAVAKERNLTRAAQKLFTSPPSVSAHIKALEEELNVELFIRTPRGMHLTEAGETLKQKAESTLSAADDFVNSAQTLCDQPLGCVRFGINIPPEWLQIPTLVEHTHAQYPHLTIEFFSSVTQLITESLQNRTLDVGYIYGDPISDAVEAHYLLTNELVIAGPAQWADQIENATWEDLADLPWICDPYYCPFQVIANNMFAERGLTCNKVMSISDDATRLELIKGGIGLAVIEKRLTETSDQVMIWETESFFCDLNFAYLKSRADEPLIRAITEQVTTLWQSELELAIS